MIQPNELENKITTYLTIVGELLELEEEQLIEKVMKLLTEDEVFFNLLSSRYAVLEDGYEPRSMEDVAVTMLNAVSVGSSLKNQLETLYNYIKRINDTLTQCKVVSCSTSPYLEEFVSSKKIPNQWQKHRGVCNNLRIPEHKLSSLASFATVLSKPFICPSFVIQDNTKGLVSAEYDYFNLDNKKYEGEQLNLRLEFASYIIKLSKYFRSLKNLK